MEKMKTLEEYIKESKEKEPSASSEAVQEYLSLMEKDQNINPAKLAEKLKKDVKYQKQFSDAISLMSIFVFVMVKKAALSAPSSKELIANFEIEPYFREFLMLSREDDKDIYTMKKFYFQNMSAKDILLGEIERKHFDSEEEFQQASKEGVLVASVYNKMLNQMHKQYTEAKAYL